MTNNTYQNALKEVYDILENTDEELVNKIPKNFMEFIHENMNPQYKSNINPNIDIDKQNLLYETSAILSLIYHSYWATEDEKKYLAEKDLLKSTNFDSFEKKDYTSTTPNQEDSYISKETKSKENISKISQDTSLTPITKDKIIIKFFKKLIKIFKRTLIFMLIITF